MQPAWKPYRSKENDGICRGSETVFNCALECQRCGDGVCTSPQENHINCPDCVECGEKISIERLTAMPFALRCRDCEQSREKAMTGGRGRSGASWKDSMAGSLD